MQIYTKTPIYHIDIKKNYYYNTNNHGLTINPHMCCVWELMYYYQRNGSYFYIIKLYLMEKINILKKK